TREEVVAEESLVQIACFLVSESVLRLNTRLGREFQLNKCVGDAVLLVGVFSPPVGLKTITTDAERSLIVNPRQHPFSRIGAVFTGKAASLKCNAIAVENGIELVEGETPWAAGADLEQVGFCELRLN